MSKLLQKKLNKTVFSSYDKANVPSQFKLSILTTLSLNQAYLLAKKKIKEGAAEEAKNIYKDILKKFPRNKKAHKALLTLNKPPDQVVNNLLQLYNRGRLVEVIQHSNIVLQQYPDASGVWDVLGLAAIQTGELDLSISAFAKVVELKPNFAGAHNNLGIALKGQGKLEEAIQAYKKALDIKPDYADAYYNMGIALRKQGNLDEAIEACTKALSIKPDFADAFYNMGNAFKDQGKLEEAIEAYNNALSVKHDYADAFVNMGNVLIVQEKLEEALEAYRKALSTDPDNAEAYVYTGNVLEDQGKLEEATEAYNKALSINPDNADAHRYLSYIKKYSFEDEQFLQVQELYKSEGLSDDKRCKLSFTLAKIYEDVGELDQAFSYLSEGNALRKNLLNYSLDQDIEFFNRLKETQPHFLINAKKTKDSSIKPKPIFILGMPRSGTSLVEQIISSHAKVVGAGELKYIAQFGKNLAVGPTSISIAAISEFKQRYLSEVSKTSNGKNFVTDKMPQNFCFIPLICAAFPEGQIVHVQRSAAATCWSNYAKYFTAEDLGYCYDLKDVVSYYALYSDLMEFWKLKYGDRIYNLNYEKLTTNQESETRKLIDHLGLDWKEACLSPHKNKRIVRTASQQQVRQKVYQGSSEAWRKYEPYLDGAFNSLPSS